MNLGNLVRKYKNFKFLLGPQVFRLFVLSVLAGLLWFACETLFIYVFQAYLSSLGLLTTAQTWIPTWFPSGLWPAVGLLVAFGFIRAILFAWRTILIQVSSAVFMKTQREALLTYFLRYPQKSKTSEIMYIYGEIVQQAGTVVGYMATSLMTLTAAVLYFLFLLKLAWFEALIGVSLLAVVVLPISLIGKKLVVLSQRVVGEGLAINEYLLMGLRNWTFLKVHRTLDGQISQGTKSLNQVLKDHRYFSSLLGLNAALPLFLGILIISTISLIGIEVTQTDPMTLVGFFYIFLRLAQSGSEANSLYGHIRMNWVGITTLYHWRVLMRQTEQETKAIPLKDSDAQLVQESLRRAGVHIIFDAVDFAWDQQNHVLKKISFDLKRGDIFLIRGPSGAGKSSLLSLILGLNKPSSGITAINNLEPSVFFDHFADDCAYVGPEPMLIPGSIKENLLFGLSAQRAKSVTELDLQQVIADVGMDQFVKDLPQGLSSILSERTELSTGQKQRLALSRMLLRKPQLLVLDEVTANLDPDNNQRIVEIIRRNSKNMTVVVVSHRDGFEAIATKRLELAPLHERA